MSRTLYALLLMPVLALAAGDSLSRLPAALQVKEDGPRTYRFVCDYYNLSTKGNLISTQRVSAEYTRGLPDGKVRWNQVTVANAKAPGGEFLPAPKREFMEGFTYRLADAKNMLQPEFFPGFPPSAFEERNLIWDTHMFEAFGQQFFDKLSLNVPYHMESSTVPLAGAGQFENKDIQLTWAGISKRNGQDGALILYNALFNKLDIKSPGLELIGRSHYWGEIWVSLTTKQLEYATLYEDVLGEMKLGAQPNPQTVNMFRKGTFEKIAPK
jgi:hypothetical protein